MEESGHPRLHWKQETPGSNPGYPTIVEAYYICRCSSWDNFNRRVDRKWKRAAL